MEGKVSLLRAVLGIVTTGGSFDTLKYVTLSADFRRRETEPFERLCRFFGVISRQFGGECISM